MYDRATRGCSGCDWGCDGGRGVFAGDNAVTWAAWGSKGSFRGWSRGSPFLFFILVNSDFAEYFEG